MISSKLCSLTFPIATAIHGNRFPSTFIWTLAHGDKHFAKYEDVITSRILWLKGHEEGINKGDNIDSYSRYIYIHGTAHEDKIGTPDSHGCVRMNNDDVIELFDNTFVNMPVLIANENDN